MRKLTLSEISVIWKWALEKPDGLRDHQPRFSTSIAWRWLAVLCVMVLSASACGGGDVVDSNGDSGDSAAEATPVPVQSPGSTGASPSSDAGDGSTTSGENVPEAPVASDEVASEPNGGSTTGNEQATESGQGPVYGGTLVFALDAETTAGWNPVMTSAATSGHIVLRQLYDPLVIEGVDGEPIPFLLEGFFSNEDHTLWTFKLRPDITFHDGLPANSAALVRHLEELRNATLSAVALEEADIQSFDAIDELTVEITLGRTFVDFPLGFTGTAGFLGSPAMYDLGIDSARNPIGTGPFLLDEWVEHEVTRVVRNPNYWRTDAEGRQLPYLDAIEFRPFADDETRFNALRANDVDASLDNGGRRVKEYNDNFKTFWQDEQYAATTAVLMNTSRPPFDNVEFRRALAQCTNRQTLNAVLWDGQPPATGPFSPGTPGYLKDSGFPAYEPHAARAVFERLGVPSFDIVTTVTTLDQLQAELLVQMWNECGLDVGINQMLQTEAVTTAVLGNFAVFMVVNHSGYSLALERFWWHSNYTFPPLVPTTNFGRIVDQRIDDALDEVITVGNKDRQRELAEEVNRAFAEGVYNIWLYHSRWLIAAHDHVHDIDNLTIPGGAEHSKVFLGRVFLAETWLDRT
ncbi:MAG: hypothetical protein F4138_00005 [Acidimicrobiia bacterium]|nr:hypothetical protein [Acidimicrobiia bacterium]